MTNIIYINDKLWNKYFMNHHHQHHHHNNERQNKTSFFHTQIKTIGKKISYWTPADHCGWWWWWSPVIKWWGIIIDQSLRCLWRRAKKIFSIFFQFYNNPDFFSFTSYWMRFKMYSNWMCKIEKFLVVYKLSLIFYKFYVLIYNLDEIIVQHIQTNTDKTKKKITNKQTNKTYRHDGDDKKLEFHCRNSKHHSFFSIESEWKENE